MGEQLHISTTHRFVRKRCRGVRVSRAPTSILLGVNTFPEYAVALTADEAVQVGMKLIELGYEMGKEQGGTS